MMKRYKAYKDSGIGWIGEIPEHWEVKKIKHIFAEKDERNTDLSFELLSFSRSKGIIPFSAINEKDPSASDLSKYKVIRPYELLENRMQAWSGMFACSTITGCVSPDYSVFEKKDKGDNTEFFASLFRTVIYIQQFANASKGVGDGFNRLYTPQFGNIFAIYPPQAEQEAIVAYLDEKTRKIDEYINERTKELNLLSELRQAEIARAVTCGINPDAPMKPGGIPWIGQIPEHWEVRQFKRVFADVVEKGHPNEPCLCATQKYGVIPQSMYENRVVVVNKGFENLKLVRKGNFVISLRSFQGGIEMAHYQGIISAAYTILQLNENYLIPEYARYLLKSYDFVQLLKICVTGIREGQNIDYQILKKQILPLPPLAEQEAIVAYLDEKTAQIDTMIDGLQKQIDYIKEYRQTLIADVVTGRVNVTE